MTIAVEESARPIAAISAAAKAAPTAMPAAASTMPETTTCATPSPKMSRRSAHSRDGFSSSPMTKRSITTPSWATLRIDSGSVKSRRPNGPIAIPAAR